MVGKPGKSGRRPIESVEEHRWFREGLKAVDGTREVRANPDDPLHRLPDCHWYYRRGAGAKAMVAHAGAKRSVRMTLYREFGPDVARLLRDPWGYVVTSGDPDMPNVGCGDVECVNPWHCEVVDRTVFASILVGRANTMRANARAENSRDIVIYEFGQRTTVGDSADRMFLAMCFSNHLSVSLEDGPTVARLGEPYDSMEPNVVAEVKRMLVGEVDVRDVYARVTGWLAPRKNKDERVDVAEALINLATFHEKRGMLLGRPWQNPWQNFPENETARAKSGAKLGRRIPPRPGKGK